MNTMETNNLMYELTTDLRNSQLTRKQNFTDLTTRSGKTVISYCALGAIGCQKGLVGFVGNAYHAPRYAILINAYGLTDQLKRPVVVSFYYHGLLKSGITHEVKRTLSDLIVSLNDDGHWTFTEIADFLDQLGNIDVLKACTKKFRKDTNEFLLETIEDQQKSPIVV